ncbi:MAG: hypothetical protein FWE68_03080 [Defluviitaleaceae bacterium]|nr:hypothetical protein [Defluviitaleaceae bacterium]
MKKQFAILLAAALAIVMILTVGATPGGVDDPLVSRSYVDDRFNQLLTVLAALSDGGVISQPNESAPAAAYAPVSVLRGQMLIGGEGAEIILRSGRAVGFVPVANGIVNITTGAEIFDGDEIHRNNMLIIPRDDGRGVLVTDDAWFLVKGEYSIR